MGVLCCTSALLSDMPRFVTYIVLSGILFLIGLIRARREWALILSALMGWNVRPQMFMLARTDSYLEIGAGHPGEDDIGGLVLVRRKDLDY